MARTSTPDDLLKREIDMIPKLESVSKASNLDITSEEIKILFESSNAIANVLAQALENNKSDSEILSMNRMKKPTTRSKNFNKNNPQDVAVNKLNFPKKLTQRREIDNTKLVKPLKSKASIANNKHISNLPLEPIKQEIVRCEPTEAKVYKTAIQVFNTQTCKVEQAIIIYNEDFPINVISMSKNDSSEDYLVSQDKNGGIKCEFTCSKCITSFDTEKNLRHHMKFHTDLKRCNICHKPFTNLATLRRHKEYYSELKYKVYKCKKCKKRFKFGYRLHRHQRTHTCARPYICDICHMTFKVKGSLDRHHNAIHLNIRRYACRFCKKRFQFSYGRSEHEEIHRRKN